MDDPFSGAQLAQNFESSRDGAVCAVCQTDGEQKRPDRSSQSEISMTGTKCEVVDTRAKSREQLSPQSVGSLARRSLQGPWLEPSWQKSALQILFDSLRCRAILSVFPDVRGPATRRPPS